MKFLVVIIFIIGGSIEARHAVCKLRTCAMCHQIVNTDHAIARKCRLLLSVKDCCSAFQYNSGTLLPSSQCVMVNATVQPEFEAEVENIKSEIEISGWENVFENELNEVGLIHPTDFSKDETVCETPMNAMPNHVTIAVVLAIITIGLLLATIAVTLLTKKKQQNRLEENWKKSHIGDSMRRMSYSLYMKITGPCNFQKIGTFEKKNSDTFKIVILQF